jgi:phage tail-like protein
MLDAISNMMGVIREPIPSFFFEVVVVDPDPASFLDGAAAIAQATAQALDPTLSAFSEISGIVIGTETDTIVSGGENIPTSVPTKTKNGTLTLKRYVRPTHIGVGRFSLDPLTGWVKDTLDLMETWSESINLKDMLIMVYHPMIQNPVPAGPKALPILVYHVQNCYPITWTLGDLNSTDETTPLSETFEFAYKQLKRLEVPI